MPSERVVLARHSTPSGEIQLQQRPLPDGSSAFEIISNGVFLMASYNQVSERALARCALEGMESVPGAGRPELRVLVGGLGMGYTLAEILSHNMASVEVAVDVVEISPHIIDWNRTCFAALNGDVMSDPRVRLIQADVYTLLQKSLPATYHAIVLDVDNGPSWLVNESNARLYTTQALERWSALLTSGGNLAIWSAQSEPQFLARTRTVFGRVEEIRILAPGPKCELVEHFVYRARHD